MTDLVSKALDALAASGLLLVQDKTLPSVVTIVTGESLHGSWWEHPKGHTIFTVLSRLEDHPDVVLTKLVSGKVTLVHRKLWPAVVAIGSAREPWQVRGLSPAAKRLLARAGRSENALRASGPAVKELEKNLLVHTEQVHTESGRHETVLEPWSAWARRLGVTPLSSAAEGRQRLEEAANSLGAPPSALPW